MRAAISKASSGRKNAPPPLTAAKRTIPNKKPAAKQDPPLVFGEYMNTIEAALYLRVSKQFLEGARYRADGSGPAYIKLERVVRYRKSALDAWMISHEHAADKPI